MATFLARIETKVGEYEFTEFLMLKEDTLEEAEEVIREEMHYQTPKSLEVDEDTKWVERYDGVMSRLQSVTPVSTFEELVDQIPSY